MARKKQLPSWDDLFDNYAGDEEASDDFRTRIGGQVDDFVVEQHLARYA